MESLTVNELVIATQGKLVLGNENYTISKCNIWLSFRNIPNY